jgi:hypothetical protein
MGKKKNQPKVPVLTSDFVAFIWKKGRCYIVLPRQLMQEKYKEILKFLHEPPKSHAVNEKYGLLIFDDYNLGLESASSIGENLNIPFRPSESLKFLPGHLMG